MGKLCLCTSLDEIYLENCVQTSRKEKKVCSCTSSFKTGVYNYFKINSMGSDVQSLRRFTFRTVFFKLVLDSRLCFYAVQANVIKQNGIDKIIVDPWHFN